ncbi:hypothetical protein ACSS7Z_11050 [Microbacterium sp. A82]|uniref:hypothetical protein n=1 Tax=unclassified Microbacterium TaxID=2609290 RepID=UPI003F2BDB5C
MRYLFSTGLIGAITAGVSMLRGTRETPVTWRAVLAWISWGITLALAVGAAIDLNRENRGVPIAEDSPLAMKQAKKAQKEQAKAQKEQAKALKEAQRLR